MAEKKPKLERRIFEAIKALKEMGQPATQKTIAKHLQISRNKIGDKVNVLIAAGYLKPLNTFPRQYKTTRKRWSDGT